MQIFYCDKCGARFSDADVQNGKGLVIGKAAFCHKCAKSALGAAQTPVQGQNVRKPSSKFKLKPVVVNGTQHKGLGFIIAGAVCALVIAGLLLYFRTTPPTREDLPPPVKPVEKKEPFYVAPPVSPGKITVTPPIPVSSPSVQTTPPNTVATQPPQTQPVVSTAEPKPPVGSLTGTPTGASFYLSFEPDDKLVLHNKPLRYTDGIPGRGAGVNNEDGPKNFRFTIRFDNDKPIVELTPGSVFVFGIKAEKQPATVFVEVSEAKGTFYARCNWADAVGTEWILRGFRVGEMVPGSSCKVQTIPDSFRAGRIDFRSADGPFYVDSLTVFPDGDVFTRLSEVAAWLKPAYPDIKIGMGANR